MQNTALDSFIKIIEQCVALTAKPLLLTLLDVEEAFEVKPCNVRIIVPDKKSGAKANCFIVFSMAFDGDSDLFFGAQYAIAVRENGVLSAEYDIHGSDVELAQVQSYLFDNFRRDGDVFVHRVISNIVVYVADEVISRISVKI